MLIEEILIIRHDEVSFGIPTAFIGQILRVPEITSLALSPREVRGLCAVGGGIVTLLDFNRLLGLKPCDGKLQENRVITMNAGLSALALLVDAVTVSLTIDQNKIEYLEGEDEAIIAIVHHDDTLIQIVNLEYLIAAIRPVRVESQSIIEKATHEIMTSTQENERNRYLVFKMGAEEYALPIDNLREILNAAIHITPMAGAGAEILGMMSLREELIVVADLRRYYGFEPYTSDKNRIMITQLQGKVLGLMIDEIVDILEFSKNDIESINTGNEENMVSGVIHNGDSLISLIGNGAIAGLFERNSDIIVDNDVSVASEDAAAMMEVVIFKLGCEEYAFNIEEVAEIIDTTPVTPVADAAEMVDGVINIRGQIVTIGSLHKRLGIVSSDQQDQKIIICHAPKGRIGFFVNNVSDVLSVNPDQMREEESAEGLFSNVLHLDEGKRLVLLFNRDISQLLKGAA
ncbi:MAG TPA: chemotaxis protein CheW [Sulfuricurvum sp.]|nr:chemotaxis protein CheW [Sulfuricurvum sp.]